MALVGHGLRVVGWLAVLVALLLTGPLLTLAFGNVSMRGDWRTATHRATGLAPDPLAHPAAVVQVYASRTFGWRGAFAAHTWIAAKPANAERYTRYEVIGWYARGGGTGLTISDSGPPDAEWYGAAPVLIGDVRGADAEAVIAELPAAADRYAYTSYSVWPGPNSNTFVAAVLRAIPEVGAIMPPNAVGRDFRPWPYLGLTDSRTGVEANLWGVLGVKLGWVEGVELNFLGLVAGLDVRQPALKVPGYGRVGLGQTATAATN